jgi:hypothetical protein
MRISPWSLALAVALGVGGAPARSQAPGVTLIQPSGSTVPANLLRLSIRFAAPASEPVLGKLALVRDDGREIGQPFLEQELWSADGRVLTILMHPARVKNGLIAREELGPILSNGEAVTLVLGGVALKRWQVGPADNIGPQPSAWILSRVNAGSKKPLVVTLDGPVEGRDADYLAVADQYGRRVAGQARLASGERSWIFIPAAPWREGVHTLVARGTLEDPAGNRLDSRFETSSDSPAKRPNDAAIPFSVAR